MRELTAVALSIALAVGGAVCFWVGQSWIHEHVERSLFEALCARNCGVRAEPDSTVREPAYLAAACGLALVSLLVVLAVRRRRPAGTGRLAIELAALVAFTTGLAAFLTAGTRDHWGQEFGEPAICVPPGAQPGSISQNGCIVAPPPASVAWIIGGLVLFLLAAALLVADHRRRRIATA